MLLFRSQKPLVRLPAFPSSCNANHDSMSSTSSRNQHEPTVSDDKDTTKITAEHNKISNQRKLNDAASHVFTCHTPLRDAQALVDHQI
jgi:hypothetical protein